MSQRPKFATSAVETRETNGEITFIAARNVKNLNGFTYSVETLLAQDDTGDFKTLSSDWSEVAIPLMLNHKSDTDEKVGNIYQARLVTSGEEQHVEMKATWFSGDKAQETRQRVNDKELTDVSITTDWGSGYSEEDDLDELKNAHIIEVSVVYAGAEPKAKILASNSIDKGEEEEADDAEPTEDTETPETETETENTEETTDEETEEEPETEDETEEETNEEEEAIMPKQEIAGATNGAKEATKEQVLNSLTKLAQNGQLRKMNKNQVIEAVKNDVEITDGADGTYVVPDAIFTEIFLHQRETDILSTFRTTSAKRKTVAMEEYSDDELNRAGVYVKGVQKAYQDLKVNPQVLNTQFLYKMQKLDYEDLEEDFGGLLYAAVKDELPQKLDEEEERAFITGDGRQAGGRKITAIVSIDAAAEDSDNVHAIVVDGSGEASVIGALLDGVAAIKGTGRRYAAMNRIELTRLQKAGLSSAAGLPFSEDTVAGAIGVDKIFVRDYIADGVAYAWRENGIERLTSANDNIEQYDIDFNQQKIEVLRRVGGAPTQLAVAAKIELPETVSA